MCEKNAFAAEKHPNFSTPFEKMGTNFRPILE
jgi:hypothetical protein